MEKISIIVPIYKIDEVYLRECIESILNQTYTEIELILVDDGSPDRCGEICDEYAEKDERIIVIHQKNQGVSTARNHGIEQASGEWIIFVDADDWIEENMCELAINRAHADQVDMVVWNLYYNEGAIERVRKNYPEDVTIKEKKELEQINLNLLRTISIKKNEIRIPTLEGPVCHLFKRSIITEHQIQYDCSLKQGEDKLFNYEYHMHISSLAYMNMPLYHYRLHTESTTHTFFAGNADTSTRILKKYYELEPRIQTEEAYRNTFCIRVGIIAYFLIGKFFLNPGNNLPGNKFKEFKKLLRTEPYASALPAIDLKPMDFSANKFKLWLLKHGCYWAVFQCYKLYEVVKKVRK